VSEATIRAQIDTTVNAVSNIGIVHDYERWAADWSNILDYFKTEISSEEVIRGWTITCESFTQTLEQFNRGYLRHYTYKIRGYFGVDDAAESEKTAVAIVEDVVEALDADDTLHDPDTYYKMFPVDCTIFEARTFAGVLCHYAEVTLEIEEWHDANS